MDKKNLAIGVFDSGMGGLTVLRDLQNNLPTESFVYLGDTARLPYGTKSRDTVKQYALQMGRVLVEKKIKALVIACNTATTAALSHLQDVLVDLQVIGVVEPGANAAISATRNGKIAVLATQTTVASGSYQNIIRSKRNDAMINAYPCSLLVALAEEGMVDNHIARSTLEHYLLNLQSEDTIVLGCTHFPVFKPLLNQIISKEVSIVDSAKETAIYLKHLLADKNLLSDNHTSGETSFLVTDSVERFQKVGEIFLQRTLSFADIELIDALT